MVDIKCSGEYSIELKIYLKNQEGYSKEYEDYRAEKEQ